MEHLQFFYFLLTFAISIVSLGITGVIYVRAKAQILSYYVFFYTMWTILVLCSMLIAYFRTNIPDANPVVLQGLIYLHVFILRYVFIFSQPLFVQNVLEVPHARLRNSIIGGSIILVAGMHHFLEFILQWETNGFLGNVITYSLSIATIVYSLILALYYYPRLTDPIRRKFTKLFCILALIGLPPSIYDGFIVRDVSALRFYPLFYCIVSVVVTYTLLKTYPLHPHPSSERSTPPPDEGFLERHAISSREQELIPLVVRGCNNKQIGEQLFISANTVKTHLRSIYAKLGVKNRYELINVVKDAGLFPPESPDR
jgi:DNA-binding CsgD family transcriptional regulator